MEDKVPHWMGAPLLIIFGLWGAYAAITDMPVSLHGSSKPLGKWQARFFNYGYSVICIAGSIAIWVTR